MTSGIRAALLLFFFIPGCSYPVPKAPLDILLYNIPGQARQLFVFLPGNGDAPDAYEKNGIIQAVRARRLPIDMIAVHAHLGYYMEGTVFTRLKQDIIDPARARGYQRIWLIGNSLGGFGAISYARQHPEDITGVVLLGPFLGSKKIVQDIKDAGGLQSWEPGDIPESSKEGWEKQLWKWMRDARQQKDFWQWIKECEEGDECPSAVYLGFGKHDRFSYGQKLMAESLPADHVFVNDGGHNWKTWKQLWNMFLDKISHKKSQARAEGLHE